MQYFIMAKVGIRQDHHERLNFKLSRLTWIAKYFNPGCKLRPVSFFAKLLTPFYKKESGLTSPYFYQSISS
jgi:hypothetical protein